MMGKASPVSFGVPADGSFGTNQQNQVQEQRRRVNMMTQLQDFELQRRLPQLMYCSSLQIQRKPQFKSLELNP